MQKKTEYISPGEKIGSTNLERVRLWHMSHLGGTQKECAKTLGLSAMAVNRHIKTLRSEWSGEDKCK